MGDHVNREQSRHVHAQRAARSKQQRGTAGEPPQGVGQRPGTAALLQQVEPVQVNPRGNDGGRAEEDVKAPLREHGLPTEWDLQVVT